MIVAIFILAFVLFFCWFAWDDVGRLCDEQELDALWDDDARPFDYERDAA